MPRVISGKFRGARLFAPKGEKTRPTSDKVKEALFSIIQIRLTGASFLDLFAGSGQIGLEAISRGAAEAVMVEQSRNVAAVIFSNIEKLHAEKEAEVIVGDVQSALKKLAGENRKFDLIFMDPPYAESASIFKKTAVFIAENNLLNDGGMLIIEHSADTVFEGNVINLTLTRCCKYGLTLLTFYNR